MCAAIDWPTANPPIFPTGIYRLLFRGSDEGPALIRLRVGVARLTASHTLGVRRA